MNVVVPVSSCDDGAMDPFTEEDWKRLGVRITQARVARGFMTAKDLAKDMGVTPRVIGDLENGRRDNYGSVTLAKLEKSLGWEHGGAKMLLGGGEMLSTPPGGRLVSRVQEEARRSAEVQFALSKQSAEELVRGIQDRVDELRRRVDVADQLLAERQDETASESAASPSPVETRGEKTDYDLVADDAYGYSHEEEDELREMEP